MFPLAITLSVVIPAVILDDTKPILPRTLPGERTAEQILNGDYPYPPSPKPVGDTSENPAGLAMNRLGKVPPVGVHPRILFSAEQLPDIRARLRDTKTGRGMRDNLTRRLAKAFGNAGSKERALADALHNGDTKAVREWVRVNKLPPPIGHYQPFLYGFVLESLDALLREDSAQGKRAATAIATWAEALEPILIDANRQPLADNTWRGAGGAPGSPYAGINARDVAGYHLLGYGYDFAFNDMTPAQRDVTRHVIAEATSGKVWMGANLPHHYRNWNWCVIALAQPLMALAIEGESGYDPRVYKLGVEVGRDYLNYGISAKGESVEAIGYTQFGLTWFNPFLVAAARRGDLLLAHGHQKAMLDWYTHSLQPYATTYDYSLEKGDPNAVSLRNLWSSHGDGGDGGPTVGTMAMFRYFYPDNQKADFLYQVLHQAPDVFPAEARFHLIEPLLWATDPSETDYEHGAKLNLPLTEFDPERGSLQSRSAWTPDAVALQFECRTDSVSASHEHADRGHFTFAALGREWSRESFRAVETKYHSNILINGLGQGYWPGPGRWIGNTDKGWAMMAACDAKDAYDAMWPKQIKTENPKTSPRLQMPRWEGYLPQAEEFQKIYGTGARDKRPGVVAYWQGFADKDGGPRMWDEDSWPQRFDHNPVKKAFRTVTMVRGEHPYVLIVDDIQKNNDAHLYEWLMQTGANTEIATLSRNDAVLCDATGARDSSGVPKPAKGERQLLVRVLDVGTPADPKALSTTPTIRLETFEKLDTQSPDGRSFGRDKRLVIGSRSVAPDYKVLLFPHRNGETLPETVWNAERTQVTIKLPGGKIDTIAFSKSPDGRSIVTVSRPGETAVSLP